MQLVILEVFAPALVGEKLDDAPFDELLRQDLGCCFHPAIILAFLQGDNGVVK